MLITPRIGSISSGEKHEKRGMAMRWMFPVAVTLFAVGCSKLGQDQSSAELAKLRSDVEYLKVMVSTQQRVDEDHGKRIASLEAAGAASTEVAYLDPAGGDNYQYIHTNVAPIIVSFVGASPIGDGTRARLRVGNLSSATFSGVDLDISYNRRAPASGDGAGEWVSSMKNIVANDAQDIPPGSWTIVEASLPGIKPDDLGYLAVKAKLNTLSLKKSL